MTLAQTPVSASEPPEGILTTIGVSWVQTPYRGDSQALIDAAYIALQRARSMGGNCR